MILRRIIRGALFAALPTLLLVGWIYLWTTSHSVDTTDQNDTLVLLKDMKQLDSTWSVDVLRSHADVNPNYDALAAPLQRLADALAQLRERAARMSQPEILQDVERVGRAIDAKATLVDDFKAQNSLFKNSLRYVPTAFQDLRSRLRAGGDKSADVDMRLEFLVNRTLRYSAVPDGEVTDALFDEIKALRISANDMHAALGEPLLNLLSHLETLLKLRSKQAGLLRSISAVEVSASIDDLATALSRLYSSELASQFRAQRLLLAYSAFALILVIAGTAFIVYRNATERRRLRTLVDEKTRELNDLATRDELTRVYNRRYVSDLLRQLIAQHARSGEPLCIALLDIDLFKSINDKHGHAAGDKVLEGFASIALRTLRTMDVLGRWGGEEFLIVLPNTSLEDARMVVRRVRDSMLSADFSEAGAALRITFSGGLVLACDGESIATAVERADQAMYRAKAAGRDRVEIG